MKTNSKPKKLYKTIAKLMKKLYNPELSLANLHIKREPYDGNSLLFYVEDGDPGKLLDISLCVNNLCVNNLCDKDCVTVCPITTKVYRTIELEYLYTEYLHISYNIIIDRYNQATEYAFTEAKFTNDLHFTRHGILTVNDILLEKIELLKTDISILKANNEE